MKIAIDVSPIAKNSKSAHKVRGVGSYINLLVENLPKYDKKNEYVFVENKKFPADADLIHYPYFDPFFITLPFNSSKKFVVTVHDLTPLVFPSHFPVGVRGRAKWEIQKRLLKRATAVIADSERSKRDVREIGGIGEEKIKTVYLAADKQFKKLSMVNSQWSIVKKYSLPKEFLLYVGDVTWNKNLPRLIEAVKKTPYKLVMVGKVWDVGDVGEVSKNRWNDDFRKVIAQIQNDSQFIRLGFVPDEDLLKIYNLATALIMPSIYEGFGLPVLEAMSCGCPVITSHGGSLAEVAGDAAFYVDEQNPNSIAAGIEKILSDTKLRADFSRRGIAQAKKFSIEKMIKDLVNIYEETYR